MPSKAEAKRLLKWQEWQQQREQQCQARIDAVIAGFGGETDAPAALSKMAEELLFWRRRMQLIAEVIDKVQAEEPFAILGAGRYWEPGKRKSGWWC